MAKLQTTSKRGRPPKTSKAITVSSSLNADLSTGSVSRFIAPNGGNVLLLGQKEVNVFDQETGKIRVLRYCAGENSVWKEEQSEYATKSPVVFRDKNLFVSWDQPNLYKFLLRHPGNFANGGNEFYMEDNSAKIEQTVDDEFLIHDAISLLRSKDIDELMAVAISFSIDTDRPASEIKHDLLIKAKLSPRSFIDSFDNPVVTMKAKIKRAEDMQIISIKEDAIRWHDTNNTIVIVPPGKDPTDIFVRYCLTEGGVAVVAQIDKELD